jgi:hypothetical protein
MKKLGYFLVVLLCLVVLAPNPVLADNPASTGAAAQNAATATQVPAQASEQPLVYDQPAYFLVYDQSGAMDSSIYRSWRQMVKMAYHFPSYKLMEDDAALNARSVAREILDQHGGRADKAVMTQIAQKLNAKVVVIARVYSMREYMISTGFGWGGWEGDDGGETLVRTIAAADLYAYNANGDKFNRRQVRESDLKDLGLQEHPEVTIKYALANVINKMENRPLL